jgi:hypothetical protein
MKTIAKLKALLEDVKDSIGTERYETTQRSLSLATALLLPHLVTVAYELTRGNVEDAEDAVDKLNEIKL